MESNLKFLSNHGDVQIYYDLYQPNLNRKIVVQIAHGMAEHKNRYQALCEYLCEQGFTVVIADHRGHGNSLLDDHAYGDMGEHGFEAAVDDMHKLTKLMRQRYRDYKYVILGHSMGSLLARRYLQLYGNEIQAMILCGTPSKAAGVTFARLLAVLIGLFKGEKHQSKLLDKLVFGSFNRSFKYRTGFEWLNSDEAGVDAYMADEACGFLFSARSYYDLFTGLQTIYRSYPKPLKNPKCPILFLSGEKDPCGRFSKGVAEAMKHLKKQGYMHVELILYPDARHELFQEKIKQDVFEDIVRFLNLKFLRS